MGSVERALWLLSPELILLFGGGIFVGLYALRSRWNAGRWLPYLALMGLLGALIAVISLWGCDERLFNVLFCDAFALAIKGITLVVAMLLVLPTVGRTRRIGIQDVDLFYALLFLIILSICLLGSAANLVTVALPLEMFAVFSTLLISRLRGGRRFSEALSKHFLYSLVFSVLILYGISWFYGVAGSTDMIAVSQALAGADVTLHGVLLPPLVLVLVGMVGKIAAVPFHQWLPDVCEGLPGVGGMIFLIMPVLMGFAGLMRMMVTMLPVDLQVLDIDFGTLLSALAALSILAGNLLALWQKNLKRFLAYLTAAQVGYLLIGGLVYFGVAQTERSLAGAVMVSQQGISAGLYSLLVHGLSVAATYAAILVLSGHTGSYGIPSYAGMHRRSPEMAWPFLIGLLSLVGIPPTAGFVARLYLLSAAVEAGLLWVAVVGVMGSVISLACAWKIVRVVFVAPVRGAVDRLPVAIPQAVSVIVACVGMLAAAIFANPLFELCLAAAKALFKGL